MGPAPSLCLFLTETKAATGNTGGVSVLGVDYSAIVVLLFWGVGDFRLF